MLEKENIQQLRKMTTKAEANKALNTIKGLVEGIYIDNLINDIEVEELDNWWKSHYDLISKVPFNEIIPLVKKICADKIITETELLDLKWTIDNILSENRYYDLITSKIQELEGVFHGILADNTITNDEIKNLEQWLFDNEELVGTYPFDEIESLIVGILEDGVITEKEKNYLKIFLSEFIDSDSSTTIDFDVIKQLKEDITISGICTINPLIEFKNKQFCFTGISKTMKRKEIASKIEGLGGIYKDTITKKTDFLIIGDDSNPCWAFSCYGRKVEEAMNMRKQGYKISIVKEIDFIDATIE